MRHRIAQAFYGLAGLAQLYMLTGCGITMVRDIRNEGLFVAGMEHVVMPGAWLALALWSLPALALFSIGRFIDKKIEKYSIAPETSLSKPITLEEKQCLIDEFKEVVKEQNREVN